MSAFQNIETMLRAGSRNRVFYSLLFPIAQIIAPATDPIPKSRSYQAEGAGPPPRCPSSCDMGPLPVRFLPPVRTLTQEGEDHRGTRCLDNRATCSLCSISVRSSLASGAPPFRCTRTMPLIFSSWSWPSDTPGFVDSLFPSGCILPLLASCFAPCSSLFPGA